MERCRLSKLCINMEKDFCSLLLVLRECWIDYQFMSSYRWSLWCLRREWRPARSGECRSSEIAKRQTPRATFPPPGQYLWSFAGPQRTEARTREVFLKNQRKYIQNQITVMKILLHVKHRYLQWVSTFDFLGIISITFQSFRKSFNSQQNIKYVDWKYRRQL